MAIELTILIADDHPVFRQGLRMVIERERSFTVLDEAEDGRAALEKIIALKPQVAVVDIHMPEMSGFDLAREIFSKKIPVEIVFLTMYKDEEMFNAAMDIGVKGYVLKDSAITDIAASIKSVAAGQPYISPQLSAFLLNRMGRATTLARQMPGLADLTPTERRVLKMIADYKTSKEIGEHLHIHHRTVDNHRTNICQKLGLQGTHSLLKFALEHKSELS